MILVVCPNLGIDVTLHVDSLETGNVHRARQSHRQAGGKGVNLCRAAAALGETTVIVGLVGGRRGSDIHRFLDEESIDSRLVEIPGESRECTILLEPSGAATVINEVGPPLAPDEARSAASALGQTVRDMLDEAKAIALMGSLQPGLAETLYRDIVAMARDAETLCLVDASGNALREALSARPNVVKPNRSEAEGLFGHHLDGDAAAAAALHRSGAELALVTGGADGVVFTTGSSVERCYRDASVDMRFGNPTGAGDALAAGLLVGHLRGYRDNDMVRLGVAAATASLAQGYGRFRLKDLRLESVRIETLD